MAGQPSSSINSNNCDILNSEQHSDQRKLTKCGQDITNIKLGDIVWCKMNSFPFWPAIVTTDPDDHTYIQEQQNTYKVHVRFLNDKLLRNWSNNIESFMSVEDLICKHPNGLVSSKTNPMWFRAVKEANDLLKLDIEERKEQFADMSRVDYDELFDDSPKTAAAEGIERKTLAEIKQESEDIRVAKREKFNDLFTKPLSRKKTLKLHHQLINHYGEIKKKVEKNDEEECTENFNKLVLKPTHPSSKLSAKLKYRIECLEKPEDEKARKLVNVKMDNYPQQKNVKENNKKSKK